MSSQGEKEKFSRKLESWQNKRQIVRVFFFPVSKIWGVSCLHFNVQIDLKSGGLSSAIVKL